MKDQLVIDDFRSFAKKVDKFGYKRGVILFSDHGEVSKHQLNEYVSDPETFIISVGPAGTTMDVDLYLARSDRGEIIDTHKLFLKSRHFTSQYRFWDKTKDFKRWSKNELFHLNSEIIGSLYFLWTIHVNEILICNANFEKFLGRNFDKKLLKHFLIKYTNDTNIKVKVTTDHKIIQQIDSVQKFDPSEVGGFDEDDLVEKRKSLKKRIEESPDPDKQSFDFHYPSEIFANYHVPYDFNRIQDCAIVGNSGKLKNQSYGKLIDSFDCVVRFNSAPVSGYEDYVGSFTTLRFINKLVAKGNTLEYTDLMPNWIETVEGERLVFKNLTDREIIDVTKKCVNKNELYFLSDQMESELQRYTNHNRLRDLSLGFRALILMLKFANNISLFGFGFYRESRTKIHYWETFDKSYNQRNKKSHRWEKEAKLIQDLENRGIITIY